MWWSCSSSFSRFWYRSDSSRYLQVPPASVTPFLLHQPRPKTRPSRTTAQAAFRSSADSLVPLRLQRLPQLFDRGRLLLHHHLPSSPALTPSLLLLLRTRLPQRLFQPRPELVTGQRGCSSHQKVQHHPSFRQCRADTSAHTSTAVLHVASARRERSGTSALNRSPVSATEEALPPQTPT
eukprot:2780149-Rhodomonas_salina.2